MCGIVGIVHRGPTTSETEDRSYLHAMMASIAHRGPDDCGIFADERACLGFQRLAIIDLSPAGHQPMTSQVTGLTIIFNGEIYNYQSIRDDLIALGYVFTSKTDTEVILHAYHAWGEACLARFNGMFAFAIWDPSRSRLFCARDRFGVKPFYYYQLPGTGDLIFGSEIKALLQHPSVPRQANLPQVHAYLAYGRVDETCDTFFRHIVQLPPAHYLSMTPDTQVIKRYWDLPDRDSVSAGAPRSREEWGNALRDLLEDSVRLRLHADVPVGTCLSGGLDSSSIVVLTNRLLRSADDACLPQGQGSRQMTFSACYSDERHDERVYINDVIAATGAEWYATFPGCDQDLEKIIPCVVWHQDEPFGSTSILAQWHVMGLAAQHGMKVMLDGQGADEVLGGYLPYFGALLADIVASGQLARALCELRACRSHHPGALGSMIAVGGDALLPSQGRLPSLVRSLYGRRQLGTSIVSPALAGAARERGHGYGRYDSRLLSLLYTQATSTSLPSLLRYEDRNSMAFSIEARTPFLDYRLAEYAFSMPPEAHLHDGMTKVALRAGMTGILPDSIRNRIDKKGFSTPEDTWFRGALRTWILDILRSRSLRARGYVDVDRTLDLFRQHDCGVRNASTVLWRVVNLELWARIFLDAPVSPHRPS